MYNGSDVFVIDLTGCSGTSEIINSISVALEIPGATNKRINLKLKNMVLSGSQLLSIKSLVESFNSVLNNIETPSEEMAKNCEAVGIYVTYVNKEIKVNVDETKVVVPEFGIDSINQGEKKQSENHFDENQQQEQQCPQQNEQQQEPQPDFYEKCEMSEQDHGFKEEEMPQEVHQEIPHDINIEEAIRQSAAAAIENAVSEITGEVDGEKITLEMVHIAAPIFDTEPVMEQAEERTEPEEEELQTEVIKSGTDKWTQPDETDNDDGKQRQYVSVYKKACEDEGEEFEEVDFYAPPTDEPVVIDELQTIYVHQTLRSGQVLEYDGHIVIIGDCHPGSEVKATGDITVWGVLGSIAHAGAKGNRDAKIRALKLDAVQLRIANCYSRRPDGTNIPYIVKCTTFTPEEARLGDDGIVLYKIK